MTGGFWHRLDQAGRNLAPGAITLMLMLLGMMPIRLPGYDVVAPELALMALYYWAIHRPDLLRPSLAFALGLLQDLLSGMHPGINPLIYVLMYWVVLTHRRFFLGTSFMMLWWGFALVACGAMVVYWVCTLALNLALPPIRPTLVQMLLTVALFPPFAWLFIRVHRAFLQA